MEFPLYAGGSQAIVIPKSAKYSALFFISSQSFPSPFLKKLMEILS